jgi:hypothetical protein
MTIMPPQPLLDFRDYLRAAVDITRQTGPANLLTQLLLEYDAALQLSYPLHASPSAQNSIGE